MFRRSTFTLDSHASRVLILLLAVLLPFASLGQTAETRSKNSGADYGIKAGVNFAELFGEDAIPESDRKVGYSFGAYASFKLFKDFKLQPEVIWSLQGETSEKKGRYDISYINVPILMKWTDGRWYTEAGPQIGFLTINTSKDVPDEIRLDNFETLDFGLNVGAGVQFWDDWGLGIRYYQGLLNLVENRDLKNSVIYLGLSYCIF